MPGVDVNIVGRVALMEAASDEKGFLPAAASPAADDGRSTAESDVRIPIDAVRTAMLDDTGRLSRRCAAAVATTAASPLATLAIAAETPSAGLASDGALTVVEASTSMGSPIAVLVVVVVRRLIKRRLISASMAA